MLNNQGYWHLLEIELQAARQNRDGNLLGISCGKNELDVLWWLLERLEHGIKGMIGEHVHLVNHVDLVSSIAGCVGGFL